MLEISPGLWHWTSRHPNIGKDVSSYYLAGERVLLDPLLPPEGMDWFRSQPPEHVLLTNRHHARASFEIQEEFGCQVYCISNGCYELEGRGSVTPFEFGDELPGGVHVHEVGAISPDETALHIPRHRALAVADGVVRGSGADGLTFVPDSLMDDPAETRAGLAAAYRRLLDELDFELLLLAHGDPVVGGAKEELAAFVAAAEDE